MKEIDKPVLEDVRYRFKMADSDERRFYPTSQETAWLIRQAEKAEQYQKALLKISMAGLVSSDSTTVNFNFSEQGHSDCVDIALDALSIDEQPSKQNKSLKTSYFFF